MDKRFLTATLVGTVVGFVAGYLIFGLALAGFMAENMNGSIMVDPPDWLWMVVSILLWAAFLAYVFTKWAGISGWKAGASAAAIIGVLVTGSSATGLFSMTTMYTGGLVAMGVDVLGSTVWSAIVGAAVGATLGKVSE